jgi:farnesyl-diphosphate farnesyltransferase
MPPVAPSNTDRSALLRGVSRSFYVSIRLLPPVLREPVAVAYLLARATDTVADTARLPQGLRLEHLRTLAAAAQGDPQAAAGLPALAVAFAPLQTDEQERRLITALPQCLAWLDALAPQDRDDVRSVLQPITRGQALDIERFGADGSLRALATAAELDEYTYLVAGCVGEFWTTLCFRHLPGFATLPRERMMELGRGYGMGLQLVNILRDAGDDLAAGRCYVPADELAAAGIEPQAITQQPERFASVCAHWQSIAADRLAMGMAYADAVSSRRVRAASALPALLGTRTLALLREAGPQALRNRVKMPRGEVRGVLAGLALTLAGRSALRSQFERLGRWDNRQP